MGCPYKRSDGYCTWTEQYTGSGIVGIMCRDDFHACKWKSAEQVRKEEAEAERERRRASSNRTSVSSGNVSYEGYGGSSGGLSLGGMLSSVFFDLKTVVLAVVSLALSVSFSILPFSLVSGAPGFGWLLKIFGFLGEDLTWNVLLAGSVALSVMLVIFICSGMETPLGALIFPGAMMIFVVLFNVFKTGIMHTIAGILLAIFMGIVVLFSVLPGILVALLFFVFNHWIPLGGYIQLGIYAIVGLVAGILYTAFLGKLAS